MVLSREIEDLTREIRAAEELRDKRVGSFRNSVEAFHSPFFTQSRGEYETEETGEEHYNPENFGYSFVSRMVPQLAFSNPRVRVQSRAGDKAEPIAVGLKDGLNRWVLDVDLARFLLAPTTDGLFAYGVVMVTMADHPTYLTGQGGAAQWPQVERISPRMHFRDPLALSSRSIRYEGHAWTIDAEDLVEQAKAENKALGKDGVGKWDLEEIKGLSSGIQDDTLHGKHTEDSPNREQVRVYDVYLPNEDYDPEDFPRSEGWNGVILTLAQGSAEEGQLIEVREERPYFGHESGPYSIFEVYDVPDDPYGLSPLIPIEGEVRDLNRHARGTSQRAASYKRVVFVDETDEALGDRIQYAEDDLVIPIAGLDGQKVIEVEIGGITEQNLAYLQLARDRLDRVSGMQEAQRGGVTGRGTATEAAIADEASDIREDFIKEQHHRFVASILRKVAFQFFHNEEIVFPLGDEAIQAIAAAAQQAGVPPEMLPDSLMFEGGEDESGITFGDLELEIEPQSMERTSEGMQQRREIELTGVLINLAAASAQFPHLKWKEIYAGIGEAFNRPGFEDLYDEEIAAQLFGMMQSQEKPEGTTGTQARAEPRMQLAGNSSGGALGGVINAGGLSA